MKAKYKLALALALIAFAIGFVIGWASVAPQYLPLHIVATCLAAFIVAAASLVILILR